MTPFARAYSRSQRRGRPSIYFADDKWRITYSGYSDFTAILYASIFVGRLNRHDR